MMQFLVAAALLFVTFTTTEGASRMTLDVYYESLCPDSRSFLMNQLSPQWRALSTFVDLRLIPFGKASFKANPEGGWTFSCQHGNNECLGNILHACGIKYSKDTTQALDFASCLMRTPAGGALCAGQAGMDFAPIEACYKSLEGQDLLQAHGVETHSLVPSLTFVPWIIMDKVWDDRNQWDGIQDLARVACDHVKSDAPVCVSG